MVPIKYIGKKDVSHDNVAGTGTIWYGNGDVQMVPEEAAPKLLHHSGSWELAEAPKGKAKAAATPKLDDVPPPAGLLGTDKLPSLVDIADGQQAQLGDVVAGAHKESGLTAEEWNELEQDERDALIEDHLEALRQAFTAPPTGKPAAKTPAAKKTAPAKKTAAKK